MIRDLTNFFRTGTVAQDSQPAECCSENEPRELKSTPVFVLARAALLLIIGAAGLIGCSQKSDNAVIVYTSQDEVYAQPILSNFTQRTGIKVNAVYDSEAVKTVGLVNRLLAEKSHPQCDVFWNNEAMRSRQLAAAGVLRDSNAIACFGYRSRRIVFNTNSLSLAEVPRSVAALTNKAFYGKVALAYPLFGTTSTHFLALRQAWGNDAWIAWCKALQANKPFVVDGNSVVVKLVAKGEAAIGLTDSDDVLAGQSEGMPVSSVLPEPDGFLISNTVALIRNAPHPDQAQKLFDYLTSPEVSAQLQKAGAIEPDNTQSASNILKPGWARLLETQNEAVTQLKGVFLR